MIDKDMLEAMVKLLSPINEKIDALQDKQNQMGVLMEHMDKKIDALAEGQQGMNEKFAKLDQVAEDVEEIKIKVSALEEVSKSQASQIREIRLAK